MADGINTAISSQAAFGGGQGKGFAGGLQSVIPVKGAAEATIFKDKNITQFSLEGVKGVLGMLVDGSLRPDSILKGFFDMFESKDSMFRIFADNAAASSNTASGGGGNGSGGTAPSPHSTFDHMAEKFQGSGAAYIGEVNPRSLGGLSPSRGGIGGRELDSSTRSL